VDPKTAHQLNLAGLYQQGQIGGQAPAGGQLVSDRAALTDQWAGSGRTYRPENTGARFVLLQLGQR